MAYLQCANGVYPLCEDCGWISYNPDPLMRPIYMVTHREYCPQARLKRVAAEMVARKEGTQ